MDLRKKILVLTNVFPSPKQPNTGFYVFEQVKRLNRPFDLKVIMASPVNIFDNIKSPDEKKLEYYGIDLFQPNYLTFPKMGVLASGYCYEKAVENLVDKIHKDSPLDMIISYWTYPEGYAAIQIGKKYKIPVMIRPRGSDVNVFAQNPILRPLIKKTLLQADRIIPVTEALKNRIKHLGVAEERLSFLHNGIDNKVFFPMDKARCRKVFNIDVNQKVVLFIGNLLPIKGIDYFLEAIEILDKQKENYAFYFLGQGPMKEKIAMTAFRFKNVKVHLMGDVYHGEMCDWINAADVLCLPSLNEGCPNVIMEALACGRPVVASAVGGVPELINDARLGILVPPRDGTKLAEALKSALTKEWNRESLTGRMKNETWDKVVEHLVQECLNLINEFENRK